MSNLQTYYHFKRDFQKVDQHTEGKWLIHGTKRRKDNQMKSLEPPLEYPSRECKHEIKDSEVYIFYPMFKKNVQGGNIQGVAHIAETELLSCRNSKV